MAVAGILLVLRLLVSLSQHRSYAGESPLSHDKTSSKISRRAKNKALEKEAFMSSGQCVHVTPTCGGMKSYTAVSLCGNCFNVAT